MRYSRAAYFYCRHCVTDWNRLVSKRIAMATDTCPGCGRSCEEDNRARIEHEKQKHSQDKDDLAAWQRWAKGGNNGR
jgi:hypothetical protein